MPQSELTDELHNDLCEIIANYGIYFQDGSVEDFFAEVRAAVLRDFSLAGVRARGLTPGDLAQVGRLGGRPRKGETAEEARARREAERGIDNGITDYDCDDSDADAEEALA